VNFGARNLINRQTWWALFFGAILAAWTALYAMQPGLDLPDGWEAAGLDYLLSLCRVDVAGASYPSVFLMWALMSIAMMAPTAVPAFNTFSELSHAQASSFSSLMALSGGYFSVWICFSALAALLQMGLANAGAIDPFGRSMVPALNAGLLLIAGLYQFSSLKGACLNKCRSPMMFFMAHWQPGNKAAFRMGLRLGAVCLGCCWALMLLAFVGGTMSLAYMGLATLLMTLEKLPSIGRYLTAPLGITLTVAGGLLFANILTP